MLHVVFILLLKFGVYFLIPDPRTVAWPPGPLSIRVEDAGSLAFAD